MGEVSFNFKDKVVLITGSGGVIGEKIALLFAQTGAKVVLVDINEEEIKRVSQICKKASPHNYNPLEIVADLSKQEDLERVMETTIKHFGYLDVLVNNAGISLLQNIAHVKAVEVFDYTIRVNLRAPYVLTHLAVPHLSKTKGCVVNVSSAQSSRTAPTRGAYGISKSGLDMLTKNSAIELGPKNIRVNSVNPGHIWPPLEKSLSEAAIKANIQWVKKNYPLRRYGEAEDVAKVIAFLSSNAAEFVTGANVPVDSAFVSIMAGPDVYNE
jgi:NAD(P)-dependent dehydrogenase (short-subunit alcohol dehydrogenase family)